MDVRVKSLGVVAEETLLAEYAQARRPDLEEELFMRFQPLARSLAMRYRGSGERNEDLLQVANLALVKALRRYDPERGKRFAAFAAPTILGEIRRHFRDHSWRLHMPRSLQERTLVVERASTELGEELGRAPTVDEVAERADLTAEDVLDVYQARQAQRSMSLDMPVNRDEAESVPMIETVGTMENGFDAVEAQMAVEMTSRPGRARAGRHFHALCRRAEPVRDRGGLGRLPDAGVAHHATRLGEAARGRPGRREPRREADVLRGQAGPALSRRPLAAAISAESGR